MSRIGKKPIIIPPTVEIKVEENLVTVKGPKGELKKAFSPRANIAVEGKKILITVTGGADKKLWGLTRALLNTMVKGVSEGFVRALEFNGIGFKAQAKGQEIELNLGFTNPVVIQAPVGVSFQVEKNVIKVSGTDKEMVGQVAAKIRAARPPEPYKGAGIKYQDEVIIRKAGKKAVTGAGV